MDVEISADDIAWFRRVRAYRSQCGEVPGAILVPAEADPWTFERSCLLEERSLLGARLERVMLAFFLHAAFTPGRYALHWACDGAMRVEVTPAHVTLLSLLSWRACMTDQKRPYGVSCWFEFDMARALEVPIGRDANDEETLAPADETHLGALHLEMPNVLQAYVEHAALEPGRRLIPVDGWMSDCCARCIRVSDEAAAAYRAAVVGLSREPGNWYQARDAGRRLFRS